MFKGINYLFYFHAPIQYFIFRLQSYSFFPDFVSIQPSV